MRDQDTHDQQRSPERRRKQQRQQRLWHCSSEIYPVGFHRGQSKSYLGCSAAVSSRIGLGAELKIRAATSSKIKPQSHQNKEDEIPTPRKIARWSHITTRQEARKNTRHSARIAARFHHDQSAKSCCNVSTWKATCPSSSWHICAKTARNTGSSVPSCSARKCRFAIISGSSSTSSSSFKPNKWR